VSYLKQPRDPHAARRLGSLGLTIVLFFVIFKIIKMYELNVLKIIKY